MPGLRLTPPPPKYRAVAGPEAARGGAEVFRGGFRGAGAALPGAEESAGAKSGKGVVGDAAAPKWLGEGVNRARCR